MTIPQKKVSITQYRHISARENTCMHTHARTILCVYEYCMHAYTYMPHTHTYTYTGIHTHTRAYRWHA